MMRSKHISISNYDPCPGSNKPAVNGHCSVCWKLWECYDGISDKTYKFGSRKGTLKPHKLVQVNDQYNRESINDNLCPNCEKREPTTDFSRNMLELTHGHSQKWCEICVVKAKLRFARDCVREIPKLDEKLMKLILKDDTELTLKHD